MYARGPKAAPLRGVVQTLNARRREAAAAGGAGGGRGGGGGRARSRTVHSMPPAERSRPSRGGASGDGNDVGEYGYGDEDWGYHSAPSMDGGGRGRYIGSAASDGVYFGSALSGAGTLTAASADGLPRDNREYAGRLRPGRAVTG